MFINRGLIKFWYIYTLSSIEKNKVVLRVLEWNGIQDILSFFKKQFHYKVYSKILFLL